MMKIVFNPFTGNFDYVSEEDLSGLVPYTGATQDVDLGAFDLTATDITATNLLNILNSLTVGGTETGQSIFSRGLVINDSGGNTAEDGFRVETTNVEDALVVDAGTNEIKFGVSVVFPYIEKDANYTLTALNHTINCIANSFTITLPTAVGIVGKVYNIKNSGSGIITVDGNSTETIDGDLTIDLVGSETLTLQSTGANWIII